MKYRFNFRELHTFIAIADYGTFAAAGEVIGLTQSAISLQIKSLEAALETQLFDRSKRPPVMNAQGVKLLKRAREIVHQCQTLKDDVQQHSLGGVLRIGVIPSVMSGMLPVTLLNLRRSHPHLMVELSSGLSAQLVTEVNRGTLDAAIVSEPAQLGQGLSWHAFVEEPLVVIAPQNTQEQVDYEILTRYPYIQFSSDTYAGQLIQTLLQDRGIKLALRMKLDSLEAIANMVVHGLGVSIVPQRAIAAPFPAGVKVKPFGNTPVFRVVGVVERVANPKSELIQVLVQGLIGQSNA